MSEDFFWLSPSDSEANLFLRTGVRLREILLPFPFPFGEVDRVMLVLREALFPLELIDRLGELLLALLPVGVSVVNDFFPCSWQVCPLLLVISLLWLELELDLERRAVELKREADDVEVTFWNLPRIFQKRE